MAYDFAIFVAILITHETISPVKGQNTVQGCDSGDPLIGNVAGMQQLRVELLDQLNKQVQGIHEHLSASLQEIKTQHTTVNVSLQAVDRITRDHEIYSREIQSIRELFNESSQQMKRQYDSVNSSIQTVDEHLQKYQTDIGNQTQESRTLLNDIYYNLYPVRDCSDIKARGHTVNGIYEICVGHPNNSVCTDAFCDMETTDSAFTVFQRRKDGSVNFNRTWADYRQGFGDRNGEFWLGNEMLHLLTSKRKYKLRIDLEDFSGAKVYAEYTTFSIKSSLDKYRLTVGGHSGNAGNAMAYNNGYQFSTSDADNLEYAAGCARRIGAAWWYYSCSHALLNGLYGRQYASTNTELGFKWYQWRGTYAHSLKASEMKLLPVP